MVRRECNCVSVRVHHRVGRVLSFFSSRRTWDSPTPLPQASVTPHPLAREGGHTRLRERGWGSPKSDEGTNTVVLFIYVLYKYFVEYTVNNERKYKDDLSCSFLRFLRFHYSSLGLRLVDAILSFETCE
jgi:hypothetical protein